jgi:hypothetical protein
MLKVQLMTPMRDSLSVQQEHPALSSAMLAWHSSNHTNHKIVAMSHVLRHYGMHCIMMACCSLVAQRATETCPQAVQANWAACIAQDGAQQQCDWRS